MKNAYQSSAVICRAIFKDIRTQLDAGYFIPAFVADGDIPDEKEAFELVMGTDAECVPKALQTRFPNTNAAINKVYDVNP